jgi:hypothetical protein
MLLASSESTTALFTGAADASPGLEAQATIVNDLALQLEAPWSVKPGLHVGRQVETNAPLLLLLPTAPFTGATGASHGSGVPVALDNAPVLQLEAPLTV